MKAAKPQIDWVALPTMTEAELLALGMAVWDKTAKGTLYLFPGSWFKKIPEGFAIVDINGKKSKFAQATEDKDTRCGMLAFGILKGS